MIDADQLLQVQDDCRGVHVAGDVEDYIVRLIRATRQHEALQLGASPRAMLALYHAAQALAVLRGRGFVIPDDVKYLIPFALVHRVIPLTESYLRGRTVEEMIAEVVESVSVPVEEEATAREE